MSCAKTAQPIEMTFGLRIWVSSRNHVLDGGSDPQWERAILRGERVGLLENYSDSLP